MALDPVTAVANAIPSVTNFLGSTIGLFGFGSNRDALKSSGSSFLNQAQFQSLDENNKEEQIANKKKNIFIGLSILMLIVFIVIAVKMIKSKN